MRRPLRVAGVTAALLMLATVVGSLPLGAATKATPARSGTTPDVPAIRLSPQSELRLDAAGSRDGATRYTGVDAGRLLTILRPNVAPTAIVVVLHGYALDGAWAEQATSLEPAAATAGWVLAFPTGEGTSWNGRNCCGYAAAHRVDDTDYVAGLVASLQQLFGGRHPLPTVGLGFSNGAMLLAEVTCRRPWLFTAVAEVAGTLEDPTCVHGRARNVVTVRSVEDTTVPVDGGWSSYTASADLPDIDGVHALANGLRCRQTLGAAGGVAEQRLVCGGATGEVIDRLLQSRGSHGWYPTAGVGRVDDNAVAVALIQAAASGRAMAPFLAAADACLHPPVASAGGDVLPGVLATSLAVRGHVGCTPRAVAAVPSRLRGVDG